MNFEMACEEWHSLNGSEVMGYCYGALGDSFAMFSHTVLCGKKFNKPMRISTRGGGKKVKNFNIFYDIVESPELVEFTDEPETIFYKLFCTRKHRNQYCNLRYKWEGNTNAPPCYHYDKMTGTKRIERFPDATEEIYFLNKMKEMGAINIGYPMPIKETVEIASKCSRFIGIDSGISHIMYSLGIPVHLRNWSGNRFSNGAKIEAYHPNKKYTLLKDFYDIK